MKIVRARANKIISGDFFLFSNSIKLILLNVQMLEFSTTAKMMDSDMHAAYIFILLMNYEWNSFCTCFLEFVTHTTDCCLSDFTTKV